ncbi:MAG: hypothetical protein J0L63_07950 [Anaerolineae bacterium]|nr:hypothetical protein [Anaerolineae bacterium]
MTFDANGNLTNDGTNTYTWDRANRLLSVGSSAYAYDGSGSRIQQTVGANVTRYLLDIQPGLTQVLAATTGASTDHYIHSLRGIHAMKTNAGAWIWPTQDGLGSVRQELSDGLTVNGVRDYEPFLTPFDEHGSFTIPFAATGEVTDVTGQVVLRNRYLNPALGQFVSLDPFEGVRDRAMSLNGYSWVESNPVMNVDPRGLFPNINEIGTVYDYSCNCGWIDWNHVTKSDERVYTLLDDIEFAKSNQVLDPMSNVRWSIYFGVPLSFPVSWQEVTDTSAINRWLESGESNLFGKFATFPQDTFNRLSISDLAISIFMDANEQFEELQLAATNDFPGGLDINIPGLGNPREVLVSSYFSEEDLVSNLLGFYIALERWKNKASFLSTEQMKERVKELCHVLSINDSKQVFQQAYQNGALAERNWRQWHPRLRTLESNCGNKCPVNRSFPSEIDQVKMGRVLPNEQGSWWWIDNYEELIMWGIVGREFIPDIRQNVAVRSPFE